MAAAMNESFPTSPDSPALTANLASEGDVNFSPLRRAWEAEHLHAKTRTLIDADSKHFLHKTLSLWDAFHGASLDAISIGGEAIFRKNIGPLLPGTEHAQPCDPRQCRFGCGDACNLRCAEYLDYVLGKEEDIGAVIIETVRSTDVQIQPPEYYRIVRDACDRYGALLILDEVPICLGRTGHMFAFEHYDIVPDMLVVGKGLGGAAFPMAALIARR